jgi:hypothetical protein
VIVWTYTVVSPAGAIIASSATGAGGSTSLDQTMPRDYALDPATGDLALPPRWVTGADAFAQRLTIRFKMWLGEWFLDQRIGVPYIDQIFVKAPRLALIERIFRKVVEKTPGCAGVKKFAMSVDFRTRQLSVTELEAMLVSGDTFIATSSTFIVTG